MTAQDPDNDRHSSRGVAEAFSDDDEDVQYNQSVKVRDLPEDGRESASADSSQSDDGEDSMTMSKARDQSRPKRKKAKRACAACQRAHLTCSDDRPCLRCVKRNLADQCHDGVRKKAKYLHDTPNEALVPGHGSTYGHFSSAQNGTTSPSQVLPDANPLSQSAPFVGNPQPPAFQGFSQNAGRPTQMGPPVNGGSGFRQSPTSQYGSHMPSPISQLSSLTGQTATPIDVSQQSYGPQYIGPGDASLFDFNLSEMNFGNHYGALEFGMLGHMSSGAQENEMSSTQNSSLTSPGFATQSYMDTGLDQSEYLPLKTDDQPSAWRSNPNEQSVSFRGFDAGMDGRLSDTRPAAPAFAIGSGNSHFPGASPASSAPEMLTSHDGTLRDSAAGSNPRQAVLHRSSSAPDTFIQQQGSPRGEIRANLLHQQHQQRQQGHQDKQKQRRVTTRQANPSENISKQLQSMVNTPAKRRRDTLRRDPSAIYSSVTQPYPYTQAFHAFSMVLKRRFHKKNVIKIAKALALIRPSFISLNHTLLDTDLIFMEKCFQRGLWDYEDYSNAYGTPTIVCRRTGEVAHVSKEFSLLTGWTKEVLLGEQPNLNVNYPSNGRQPTSGTATASSSRGGFNTPRGQAESTVKPEDGEENQQPTSQPQSSARQQQPVFLAELMDEDSVVRFYEDYSTLAFADSKGSAWSPCNVLQYKTQQMSETAAEANATSAGSDSEAKTNGRRSGTDVKSNQDPVIRPAERMWRLGSSDGKVHCMYCWMVKRDVFNIPMMIVVNFLPILKDRIP